MSSYKSHKWTFRGRFRRRAFGWRSQPPITRIKEAVSEIKKEARRDAILGADGAVLFLERVAPALENVDSSSGAIGTAVRKAIAALVPIIAAAQADETLREEWLERLWQAVQDDEMPYIESVAEYWGELCATPAIASRWADRFTGIVRMALSPDPRLHGYFKGTPACLSALYTAGRHDEILELLDINPKKYWLERGWGVKALVAMGKKSEALAYAKDCHRGNRQHIGIAMACEEILLSSGMAEEAYNRYAIEANQKTTYLATFNAIVKKYPRKKPGDILRDLVATTPGDEGKWFAAAKSAGLYDEAIEMANRTPCDPRTLTRAARDMGVSEPRFAVEAGVAALRWLVMGYGYEITSVDVWAAYKHAMQAAENAGCRPETFERIRKLVAGEVFGECFVRKILGRELGLSG